MESKPWLIFDGDNTLWKIEHFYDQARIDLCNFIVSRTESSHDEVDRYQRQRDYELHTDLGYSCIRFPTSFTDTVKHFLGDDANAEIAHVSEIANKVFHQAPAFSDCLDHLIPYLKNHFKLGLITCGEKWVQQTKIDHFHLSELFDEIEIVDKKDSLTFRNFTLRNNVDIGSSWAIGDSLKSDVEPALICGLNVIWIRNENWTPVENNKKLKDIEQSEKIISIDDIAEITTIVKEPGMSKIPQKNFQTPRNIFVSMLFALVLGNSSILLNEILFTTPVNKVDSLLVWGLGFLVIITSWVDWSSSFSEKTNDIPIIDKLVSKEFFKLIIDIFILYLYSALFANIPIESELTYTQVETTTIILFLIFTTYTLWDEINYRREGIFDGFWALAPGGFCALFCLIAYFISITKPATPAQILCALYLIVIGFRIMHGYRKEKLKQKQSN